MSYPLVLPAKDTKTSQEQDQEQDLEQDQDQGRAGNTEHNTVNTVAEFAAESKTKRKHPTILKKEVLSMYISNPSRSATKH